jgi:hypothetical protein
MGHQIGALLGDIVGGVEQGGFPVGGGVPNIRMSASL